MAKKKKKFLVVVDAQNDFMLPEGALYVPNADKVIAPLQEFIHSLDPNEYEGILVTFDTHNASTYPASAEALQFPPHCYKGSNGWNLAVDLYLNRNNLPVPMYRLEKGVFDMWAETDLKVVSIRATEDKTDREKFFQHLRDAGVDTITVTGVAADYCVKWAIDGFVKRGFLVEVPEHLTAGIADQIDAVVAQNFGPTVSVIKASEYA